MSLWDQIGNRVSAVLSDAFGNAIGSLANPIRNDPVGTTAQPISGSVTANQTVNGQPVSANNPLPVTEIINSQTLSLNNPLPVQLSDGAGPYSLDALLRLQRNVLELEMSNNNLLQQQNGLFIPQSETLPFLGA